MTTATTMILILKKKVERTHHGMDTLFVIYLQIKLTNKRKYINNEKQEISN